METELFNNAFNLRVLKARQTCRRTGDADRAWAEFGSRDVRNVTAVNAAGISNDRGTELPKKLAQFLLFQRRTLMAVFGFVLEVLH